MNTRNGIILLVIVGIGLTAILIHFVNSAGTALGVSIRKSEQQEQLVKEKVRRIKDSASRFVALSDTMFSKRKYDSALALCNTAISIDSNCTKAYLQKGSIYRSRKKFDLAVEEFAHALRHDKSLGKAWYEKALCLIKQGEKREAVDDLKQAIALRYPGADSVYEKINPLKKRITGSHTVCCDGSTSHSSGRGTCSHHGGVCGTEYEYQTYREY